MRDGRRRTRVLASLALVIFATLAASIFARFSKNTSVEEPPTAAPPEAPAPAAEIAAAPAPEVTEAATRCPAEPPIATTGRVRGAVSKLLFGRPDAWGSASVGTPTRGWLIDGVELGPGDGIELAGDYHWGTATVVRSVERAVREVRRCHPQSPDLYVGDISREEGGWLRPHRSHQAGLDADIGFYYLGPASWYERATAKNLDVVRTWALWRALVDGGNVDMIFVDRSVQDLVKAYLATLPASERPPEGFFERSKQSPAIVRHAWGHATHFHVRFRDPEAVALGAALAETDDKARNRTIKLPPKRFIGGRPKRAPPRPKKR